nr:helix-turn-helix domain-containing protein [uncultured Carboxylicivirga sp.]
MNRIFKVKTVTEYNNMIGQETLHPLISVIDFEKLKAPDCSDTVFPYDKSQMTAYAIFLKDIKCGNVKYGLKEYDYEEGTLMFIGPEQVFAIDLEEERAVMPTGRAIIFHPDLLLGTALGRNMKEYTFFSYEVNEALHLSASERQIINECLNNIDYELKHSIDKHSKTLIVSYLELFLNYCQRFYDRQFITRNHVNKDILSRFEQVINNYFKSEKPLEEGLPSVSYCADKLFLSPNYLGDLLKKETGKSAQEHIQLKVIEVAKQKIFDASKTINEIAYELGFKHPQHFARMFKKKVGVSPNEYRKVN